jgi:tetratricopeptide (TPR) repeat protein
MKTTDTKYPISNSGQPDSSNGVQSNSPSLVKSTSSSGKIELWIALGIFFLALCVRYFYLYESSANPTFEAPISDPMTYHRLAQQLAEGKDMTGEFFWQPLFYPLFLAVVYYFSDLSIVCAKSVQVILGGFTCILTYFLAKRIFGRRAGILAAVIVSLYGPLIFFETELLAAGWASFWSLVLILLFLKARDTKGLLACFLLGVCGAMSIITRPTFLPFFTAGCLWLVFTLYRASMSKQFFVLRPAAIVVGFALIAVPVAYQCYHLTGHFGILPSSGGLNLYIGNNPDAAETTIIRPGADWEELTNLPVLYGMGEDRWVRQRFFHQKVREYILSRPVDFAKGLVRKTLQFFSPREIPRNVDIYLFRRWSGLLTFLMWKIGRFGFPFGLLLPLTIVGLFFRWRQIPVPVILFIFFYTASIVLVFISARYRIPMVPVMCCLAAGGIAAISKMIRLHQSKRLAVTTGCVFGIALLSSFAGPFPEEKVNYVAELHYGLGYHALQSGKFDQAVGHCETAIRLNPDFAEAYNNLGLALVELGESEEAISCFEKTLQLKPKYIKAYSNMARAFMKQGNPSAAIERLEEALTLAPMSVKLLNNLGAALAELGNLDEAIEQYSKVLRIKPDDTEARYSMANLLAEQGKLEDALAEYSMIVQINPNHAEAHYKLATYLARQGKFDEAIRHFSEVLRIKPDHADAHYCMGNALAEQGKLKDALAEYSKTVEIDPNHAKARYNLAICLAQQGRTGEAIWHLSEVLRINPDNAGAYYCLGKALAEQNRMEEAIESYHQALRLKPDWPEALNSLARVYATNENHELRNGPAAVQLAQRACELTGYKNPRILDTLAAAYAEAGRFSEAVTTAETAIELAALSGQNELAEKIRDCLGLYKARKAYR